jgi:hypothetical protein
VVISLQRLGLAIGTMRLLSVPGRRSGELRTTPVSPLTMSGLRYVVGLQDADWVKNARTAGWGSSPAAAMRNGWSSSSFRPKSAPPSCGHSRAKCHTESSS